MIMNNTKAITACLYGYILPFINTHCREKSSEEIDKFLDNSTVGFGITYKMIVLSAKELNLLVNPINN